MTRRRNTRRERLAARRAGWCAAIIVGALVATWAETSSDIGGGIFLVLAVPAGFAGSLVWLAAGGR